jgi:hypothetical protein
VKFDFQHFLLCPVLGPDRSQVLHSALEDEDWGRAALTLLSRFELFVHYLRDGALRDEETDLFSLLLLPSSPGPPSKAESSSLT